MRRGRLRTIAIANQKGGCGKTTVAVNLAACLSFLGKKVLLIDLDPQGHASLALGVRPERLPRSLYDVLDDREQGGMAISDVVMRISSGLFLVPSEIILSAIVQKLAGMPDRENRLLHKLEELDADYDFILIDCPPNLGLLTFNALRAAKELIIPVECSFYSLHGLAKILETVKLLREALDHSISMKALMNGFDGRTRFSRRVKDELVWLFSGRLFRSTIHHSIRLREAAAAGKPITEYDRNAPVFKDFINLSAELIESMLPPPTLEALESFTSLHEDFLDKAMQEGLFAVEGDEEKRTVLLTLAAPQSRSVLVAGDFNHWIPEEMHAPLKGDGVWRKLFHLKAGAYRYKFIIDGDWTCDPENLRAEANPFGGRDSLLVVNLPESVHGW